MDFSRYQYKNKVYVIEGSKGLEDKSVSLELKEDHFVCLCASVMLMTCPVSKWDTKKVNIVIDNGIHVFSHADDLNISEKRIIKNILVEKHFFDLIVKRIKIENYMDRKNLNKGNYHSWDIFIFFNGTSILKIDQICVYALCTNSQFGVSRSRFDTFNSIFRLFSRVFVRSGILNEYYISISSN